MESVLDSLLSVFASFQLFPLTNLQIGILAFGLLATYLLAFATRDILLRSHSILYQIVCIGLVGFLPGFGFLLYLLVRPPRTLKEREIEQMLRAVVTSNAAERAIVNVPVLPPPRASFLRRKWKKQQEAVSLL